MTYVEIGKFNVMGVVLFSLYAFMPKKDMAYRNRITIPIAKT